MIRFLLFLIQVQWRDRIATSAFLIGITLQNLLMGASVYKNSDSAESALLLAVRACLLSTISIALLSAMSSIQNEFRYGTAESIVLSRYSFFRLIAFRALFTSIVSSPAILLPLFVVLFKYPNSFGVSWVSALLAIYFTVSVIGFQTSYILNLAEVPSTALPWVRNALLIAGLTLIPTPLLEPFALALPIGWCLRIAQGGTETLAVSALGLLTSAAISTVLVTSTLTKIIERKIELKLTSGRAGS